MAQSCALLISTAIILVILSYQAAIIAYGDPVNGVPASNNNPSNKTTTNKTPPTAADGSGKSRVTEGQKPGKSCPDRCLCPSEDTIDCSGKKLETMPQIEPGIAGSIKFLNLSNNALENIDPKLYITYKKMKLEKLDLSHNKFQTMSFKNITFKVAELDMSYNNLSNLANNVTTSVAQSIERLKLNNNLLAAVPEKFFELFGNLTSLDISNNPMKSIHEHLFESTKKLDFLNLSSLQLTELKGGQFHGVDQLKTLDLSNNQFSHIPNTALRGARNLQKLIFSSNPIKALGDHDLYLIESLRHLEIGNCTRLEKVDAEAFESLKDIEMIIISQNPNLSKIDPLAFKNNTSPLLRTLDISSNNLSTLDQMSLKWETIDNINLSQNPWHCDCEISWLKSLHTFGNMHCASPDIYKDMEVTVVPLDCGGIPFDMKITLILLALLAASILIGSMMAIKHNSFCRRLLGREQYSSVYYTKAEFGPMDTL